MMTIVPKQAVFLGCVVAAQLWHSAIVQAQTATDLISFAQGALPISIDTADSPLRVGMEHAVAAIDGSAQGFVLTPKPGTANDAVEIVYRLPAPTRFSRFAVPNVAETPSPSQTFFKNVTIFGSVGSASGPYVELASGTLALHEESAAPTELMLAPEQPEVKFVKLRLRDGLSVERDKTFFEFSELVGNGTQQEPVLSESFNGAWKGRGVNIELKQEGATVQGCYDGNSMLTGTVRGNVLRALGADAAGIPSQFILIGAEDGSIRGLRSTNGAPFKIYDGEVSNSSTTCLPSEEPKLGCGSTIHGIGFDFDSAVIRPGSLSIIDDLYEGLADEHAGQIRIVGHSSSEGAKDYNRDLSQRRANSVVAELVARGIDQLRISADGRGEDEPIASNDDEAGRSLNRRVEIECTG